MAEDMAGEAEHAAEEEDLMEGDLRVEEGLMELEDLMEVEENRGMKPIKSESNILGKHSFHGVNRQYSPMLISPSTKQRLPSKKIWMKA